MSTLHLQGKTDDEGKLVVHLGRPNASVNIDLTLLDEPAELSQEQWSAQFEELAQQIDPAVFQRLPQTPLRDAFNE